VLDTFRVSGAALLIKLKRRVELGGA
jgi:hypothetical protein